MEAFAAQSDDDLTPATLLSMIKNGLLMNASYIDEAAGSIVRAAKENIDVDDPAWEKITTMFAYRLAQVSTFSHDLYEMVEIMLGTSINDGVISEAQLSAAFNAIEADDEAILAMDSDESDEPTAASDGIIDLSRRHFLRPIVRRDGDTMTYYFHCTCRTVSSTYSTAHEMSQEAASHLAEAASQLVKD